MLTDVLENKKVTGPLILFLLLSLLFLWFWRSEPQPQKHTQHQILEEEEHKPSKVKESRMATTTPIEEYDSYLDKRTYIFTHLKDTFRRVCRVQATSTSSCTRLSCDDGKIYCVSSYTELSN